MQELYSDLRLLPSAVRCRVGKARVPTRCARCPRMKTKRAGEGASQSAWARRLRRLCPPYNSRQPGTSTVNCRSRVTNSSSVPLFSSQISTAKRAGRSSTVSGWCHVSAR
jgi:hypothetical protein